MDEGKRELVESWLTKASHDLRSATALANLEPPLFDTAVYHCQQAAEKAIKGFLVFNDVVPQKTHLLGQLIPPAAQLNVRFALFSDAAEFLTPLATEYRYPGASREPTQQDYDKAMQYAEELYNLVLELLPQEAHPKQ